MLSKHDAIDATSSARWRGARAVSTRGQRQCLKMEKLGRIRDAASDSSSVSSLGDLRSTDLMPSDCAWGVCMNLRQRKSLVARRETRSRGDLNFAQMHLIIAHAVRGRYAQRCACYGRWMRTTCAGRSMRGTPTCTRTAALGEATGANALPSAAKVASTAITRFIVANK